MTVSAVTDDEARALVVSEPTSREPLDMVEANECQHQRVVDVPDFQHGAETLGKGRGGMRSVVTGRRIFVAEPFKNLIDGTVVRALGGAVSASAIDRGARFDRASFERDACAGLSELELLDRGRHVGAALREHLPGAVPRALAIVVGALEKDAGGGSSFRWLPVSALIEALGDDALRDPRPLDDAAFEACLEASRALTQRFTAEWCVRPLLQLRERETLARLTEWTRDPSEHTRRLCSEGTRTRLPWGRRLDAFIARPAPVLALIEHLKDDESEYVRRSVANSLNDLSKDHAELVITTCARWWEGGDAARRKLVKHALRTLVKRGDARALAILGMDVEHAHAHVTVTGSVSPKRVPIGGSARVSITAHNADEKAARVVIDLVVHYVKKTTKKSGKTSPKVFKGKTLTIAGGETIAFERTLAFVDVSIRKHEPGAHAIEAKVNGKLVPLGTVTLTRS